jgi:hypothetical protein
MSDFAANAARIAAELGASGASSIEGDMEDGEVLWTSPDRAWRCWVRSGRKEYGSVFFRAVVWPRRSGPNRVGADRATQEEAIADALAMAVEDAT